MSATIARGVPLAHEVIDRVDDVAAAWVRRQSFQVADRFDGRDTDASVGMNDRADKHRSLRGSQVQALDRAALSEMSRCRHGHGDSVLFEGIGQQILNVIDRTLAQNFGGRIAGCFDRGTEIQPPHVCVVRKDRQRVARESHGLLQIVARAIALACSRVEFRSRNRGIVMRTAFDECRVGCALQRNRRFSGHRGSEEIQLGVGNR